MNFRAKESASELEKRRKKARENYVPVSNLSEDEKQLRRDYEREKKRRQRMQKKDEQTSGQDASSA